MSRGFRPPLAARKDRNHRMVVKAYELVGASPEPLSERGKPDLLVGYLRQTYLVEVKKPAGRTTYKKPSGELGECKEAAGKLEPAQEKFIGRWRGRPVRVVDNPVDALLEIGIRRDVAERVAAVAATLCPEGS